MNCYPGEAGAKVAGGATDRYVSGWLGLGVRIPERAATRVGADPASSGENSEPASGDSSGGDEFDAFD